MNPTVLDARTGERIPVYIGADPAPEPPKDEPAAAAADPAKTEENKDASGTPAAADPAAPAATPDASADAAKPDGEAPSDSVAQGEGDEPSRDEKGRFIPKARFDEVNERRKAAEKKLAEREAADAAATAAKEKTFDFEGAEKAYMELLLDGKLDEAAAKRKEIRAAEQEAFRIAARTEATAVTQQQTVKERIDAIAQEYEAGYPAFDPNSDSFSEDAVDDLRALYAGFLDSGRYEDAPAAFQAALDKTIKMHGFQKAAPAAAPAGKPASPAAPARTAQSRVEAIVKQPPVIAKTGSASPVHGDAGNLKPSEMTEAEILRLPEATRRKLRGDII